MPDDELYSRFLAGDTSAADTLIARYTGRLIMYADAVIHDIRDAEDLVIETFAVILTKRPAIRKGGFQAYLYQSVRRRAYRFRVRRSRMSVFSLNEEQARELEAVHPEDEFLRDERRRTVRRCLNRIDPECREALWLTFFEGMSYAEAAAVMGVNKKDRQPADQRQKNHEGRTDPGGDYPSGCGFSHQKTLRAIRRKRFRCGQAPYSHIFR